MGITNFTYVLLKRVKLQNMWINHVLDVGAQNDYTVIQEKPPFANELYKRLGINNYTCIDLSGDNNSIQVDLSKPIASADQYDLVTDIGSSEHCVVMKAGYVTVPFLDGYINSIYPKEPPSAEDAKEGYYNCWLNKHNLLKVGGIMVNENPMTGNWKGHGYSYIDTNFYYELCKIADYKLIDTGTEAATGNTVDGWNVWGIIEKIGGKFPTIEEFYEKLPISES